MPTTARGKAASKRPSTQPAPPTKKAARKSAAPTAKPKKNPAKPFEKAFADAGSGKAAKVKKPKMVRDSFTMPKTEYAVLDELKGRALKLARPIKKSELLRAGIKALAAMADAAFLQALKVVPALKTGRPKKS